MKNKKIKENKVAPEHYLPIKTNKTKIIIFLTLLAFTGFITNFPFNEKIESFVQDRIKSIPNCPINYKDLQLEYIFPKIIIRDAKISSQCLGQTGQDIMIDELKININGLSHSPIGLSSSTTLKINQSKINIQHATSISRQNLIIENSNLDLTTLLPMLTNKIILNGNANISGSININDQIIDEAFLNIESSDIKIPPQSIMIFNIPAKLAIGALKLKASLNPKNQLKIEHLILGDERSPLRASFSGTIYLLPKNIANSTIDLKGEFNLSEKLLNMPGFSLISTLLSGFDKKDGFYQIKIRGTLGNPTPESI